MLKKIIFTALMGILCCSGFTARCMTIDRVREEVATIQAQVDRWKNPSKEQVADFINRLNELKGQANVPGSNGIVDTIDRLIQKINTKYGAQAGY